MTVEKKPVPPVEVLTSDVASEQYNSDLESWGERGWAAVARICGWAKAVGFKGRC